MKVKICGLRRAVDAELAIELGASHVGIVFAPDSERCATVDEARRIVACARYAAEPVLVFRGVDDEDIVALSERLRVRSVQVHDADLFRCRRLASSGVQPMPVVRVEADARSLSSIVQRATAEQPMLLDGGHGGEGVAFDWALLGKPAPAGLFVAGGIRPDNVRDLLRYQPWGIDVSSGVERVPGQKDERKLRELFRCVQSEVTR